MRICIFIGYLSYVGWSDEDDMVRLSSLPSCSGPLMMRTKFPKGSHISAMDRQLDSSSSILYGTLSIPASAPSPWSLGSPSRRSQRFMSSSRSSPNTFAFNVVTKVAKKLLLLTADGLEGCELLVEVSNEGLASRKISKGNDDCSLASDDV